MGSTISSTTPCIASAPPSPHSLPHLLRYTKTHGQAYLDSDGFDNLINNSLHRFRPTLSQGIPDGPIDLALNAAGLSGFPATVARGVANHVARCASVIGRAGAAQVSAPRLRACANSRTPPPLARAPFLFDVALNVAVVSGFPATVARGMAHHVARRVSATERTEWPRCPHLIEAYSHPIQPHLVRALFSLLAFPSRTHTAVVPHATPCNLSPPRRWHACLFSWRQNTVHCTGACRAVLIGMTRCPGLQRNLSNTMSSPAARSPPSCIFFSSYALPCPVASLHTHTHTHMSPACPALLLLSHPLLPASCHTQAVPRRGHSQHRSSRLHV
jgi:hypothetical protein